VVRKTVAANTPGTSWKRILGAVGTIALLIVYPMIHANTVMHHALQNAFPGWEITYKSTWPRILGGVSAREVSLHPYGEQEGEETYQFDRVTIAVPFVQYYWSLTKGRKFLHAINTVNMKFEGGRGNMMTGFSEGLDFVGTASLSPFEALGCLEDDWWNDEELVSMGLPDTGLTMELSWTRADRRLRLHHRLARPGVGRLVYTGERGVDESVPLLGIYEIPLDEPASERWHVVDDGFIKARNRHCARKDDVEPETFVDRHLLAVRRALQAEGLAPTRELELAYRDFASRGGEFELSVEFPRMGGLRFKEDAVLGNLAGHLSGNIVINGEPLGLALREVHARPLPENSELTLFQIVQREQAAAAEREGTAPADPVVVATPVTPIAATIPAPPDVAAAAPAAVVVAGPAETSPAAPQDLAPPPVISNYRDLGKQVGRRYTVFFKFHPPMRVEVVGIEEGAVKVRRRLQGGWTEHRISSTDFDRAELMR